MRHCARKRIIRIFIATTMTALVVTSFGVMPAARAAMVPNFFTDDAAVSTNSGIAAGGGFGNGTNSQTAVSESSVQLGINTGTGSDGSFTPSLGNVAGGCASAKGMTWSSPTCTIDTDNATYNGQYDFTDVAVTAGTILTAVGTKYLFLKATGTVTVTGIIDLNGENGSGFTGGSGGAGGSRGGSGGAAGGGGGGGSLKIVANQITLNTGGVIRVNGGSGAGGGGAGGVGGAGEGLGGGGYIPFAESAGGAGFGAAGGAAAGIAGGATYNILNAGGSGGGSGRSTGGGGSGGGIRLNAITFNNNGIITANGGTIFPNSEAVSGGGGGGRIEVTYSSGIAGIITANGAANGQSVVPAFVSFPSFYSNGVFTSASIDFGGSVNFTTTSWNATLNGQTITVKARSSADGSTWRTNGGAPNSWTNCVNLTSGSTLSSGGCVTDGDRYIQYQAALATSDTAVTPALNDITINYQNSANYNFLLSASSPADAVTGAASSKISTMTVTVQNPQDASITDQVNFTAAVSPAGPTISFSPASCVPSSGTCAVDLYASAVTAGNYTVTVRGSNASATYPFGIARTVSVALTVLPALDFSLALSLGSGEVIRGYEAVSYVDTVLTIGHISGANEIVSFTGNAPLGITFNASPTACAPSPGSCTSTIRMNAQNSIAAGNYTFTITGTAAISGGVRTASFTLRVRDPLNYSLSASPPSGAAFQGNSATATITGTYGGYPAGTENVTFASFSSVSNPSAFSSVPLAGTISVSFSPSACALGENQPSCAKSVTISTSSNTTVGDYVITLTGVSSITNTARTMAYAFTVSGPFDFTMAYPSPPCATSGTCAGTVEQAASMNVTVNVASLSAAGENVSLSITGLPVNTAYSVSSAPNPCVPTVSVPCTATLTISPAITASLGTYAVNIVGTSTKRAHLLPFTLTIAQGFTFDVALSASSGVAVRGGSAESVVASISLFSGTGKLVTLSVDGLTGSGVVAGYPGGQSCTPNCQQQITFTAPSSAVLGVYTLNITGTAGTQTKQAAYMLTVVDPFDFSLSLSSTQGSITQGGNNPPCVGDNVLNATTGKCDKATVAKLKWLAGGSGEEVISLSASVPNSAPFSSTDIVSFDPPSITGLTSSSLCSLEAATLCSTVTLTAPIGLMSKSYSVVIIAQSGTLIKTKTYNLTVGTTLDFTLTFAPDDEERVMQGASSTSVAITALNKLAQPASSDISFTVGDTPTYKLPKNVTVAWDMPQTCTLGAPLNATCASALTFVVGSAAVDGTYLIPIVGTSGFMDRIAYFTLKIGQLNLIKYPSPDLMPDAHQRPQVSFTWSPPAVFAGDTVQFDAAPSTVYDGEPNLLASTPVSNANADFSWSFAGITRCSVNADCSTGETCLNGTCYLPGSTLINPQVFYQNSGMRDITLTVTDIAGGCYTSTTSSGEEEPCACSFISSVASGGGVNVSKPRPAFREITPQ